VIDDFACPVCRQHDWATVERFVYGKATISPAATSPFATVRRRLAGLARVLVLARPRTEIAGRPPVNEYQSRRRSVLFDVWFPGRDRVTLTSVCCRSCGFMTYTPRPTDVDIAAKYGYLKEVEPDIGGETGHDSYSLELDMARARRIYRQCIPYLDRTPLEVLDYGGGNGKLMRPFLEAGHQCYLIDYNDHPIADVTKLCNDIEGLDAGRRFDLIVCSHVFEHVADISGLVSALRSRLAPDGIIYAEVPQEIWAGVRLDADPVTHINYFTRNSLKTLFLTHSFDIVGSDQQIANYAGAVMEVIWVVARPASVDRPCVLPPDTHPLLYPPRTYSARKMYRLVIEPKMRELIRKMQLRRESPG
jgi:SAM-dependent methyltransferase